MKLPAMRCLASGFLLAICLTGLGVAHTRSVRHAPAAAREGRMRQWNAYWRRALPLWGGAYGMTLLGVLAAGLYLNRVEAAALPSQNPKPPETWPHHAS